MRGHSQLRLLPAALLMTLAVAGCVSSGLVPSEMEPHISRDLTFDAIKQDPEKAKGRLVVLGGKVLAAKRLQHSTQIEVLQLPLDQADAPLLSLAESRGRFLAFQQEFLDPAKLPEGTMISMIAEVAGSKTQPLDDVEYSYPTVTIRTLKIWSPQRYVQPVWPYYYPYPYPFYGPRYPYWWDPWW